MITIKTNVDQNSKKFFRGVITNYIDSLGYDVDICRMNEIRSCISEMISNVLVHAYPDADNKPVIVTIDHIVEDDTTKLVIVVEDEGVGMEDVTKCMEPMYTTVGDESRCGLGFTILETMSDNLLVTSNRGSGTKVEITKLLY
jgi:stage II sporulation protein AB (anti-sigma F factor)